MDIKLENLVLDDNFTLKICDFGFAHDITTRHYHSMGTGFYQAPEIVQCDRSRGYSWQLADIFALGVTFFILVFGVPPFLSASNSDQNFILMQRASRGGLEFMKYFARNHQATRTTIFQNEGSQNEIELLEMLFSMMNANPDRRPQNAL